MNIIMAFTEARKNKLNSDVHNTIQYIGKYVKVYLVYMLLGFKDSSLGCLTNELLGKGVIHSVKGFRAHYLGHVT